MTLLPDKEGRVQGDSSMNTDVRTPGDESRDWRKNAESPVAAAWDLE